DPLFLWMSLSQTGGCAFFVLSAFIAPPGCERSSSRRDCMSRRSNHSPGADGLPLLERNEEARQKMLFSCVRAQHEGGLRDQRTCYASSIGPNTEIVVKVRDSTLQLRMSLSPPVYLHRRSWAARSARATTS